MDCQRSKIVDFVLDTLYSTLPNATCEIALEPRLGRRNGRICSKRGLPAFIRPLHPECEVTKVSEELGFAEVLDNLNLRLLALYTSDGGEAQKPFYCLADIFCWIIGSNPRPDSIHGTGNIQRTRFEEGIASTEPE